MDDTQKMMQMGGFGFDPSKVGFPKFSWKIIKA